MRHLKKFLESQTSVDNEDIINIVQDVRDLGFQVRVNVKYTYKSEVGPHFNFNVITRDAKFSGSVKCYCIDIRKILEEDIPEKLSDLFNSLEETNSRFSEIGQTIQNISINTRNGYPSQVDCNIKFIVVTGEEIGKDQGTDVKLIKALNDAGFKTSKGNWETEIWVDLFEPIKIPEGFYIGSAGHYSVDPDLRNQWDESRQKRHQELTEKWQEIKKIARQAGIGVRRLGTSNGYDSLKIRITDKKSKVKLNENVSGKDPFKIEMIKQIKDLFYILEDEGNKVDLIQTNQGSGLKSLEIFIGKNGKNTPEYLDLDYFNEFLDRSADIAVENGFGISHVYPNRIYSGRNEYIIRFEKLEKLSGSIRGDYAK